MKRIGAVVAGAWLAFAAGCGEAAPVGEGAKLSDAQMFTLKDTSGREVSLESLLEGRKAVLVNFWATWCPPCREEIPDLIRLQNEHAASGAFTVVGVDVGESPEKVAAFAQKNGMNFPLLLDRDNAVAESYGVVGIPTSLLVSSDRKILGVYNAATPKLFEDVKKAVSGE